MRSPVLAMAIGVGSVVVLTALGEGARRFVSNEFSSLGTHLLVVIPGKTETTGSAPPLIGGTPRDLTLDDALALKRAAGVAELAPVVIGSGPVSYANMSRDTPILGTVAQIQKIRNIRVAEGQFLPDIDPRRAAISAVLGHTLKEEIFGDNPAVGAWIRVEDRRFRVVGVLEEQGNSFDLDWNEIILVPVATAQQLFDTQSIFRVLISRSPGTDFKRLDRNLRDIIIQRHDGDDDITVLSQDSLLKTFDRVLSALTLALAGIAAISLIVAGILIMNVMLVSVSQRTAEVGLLMALGATRKQVLTRIPGQPDKAERMPFDKQDVPVQWKKLSAHSLEIEVGATPVYLWFE